MFNQCLCLWGWKFKKRTILSSRERVWACPNMLIRTTLICDNVCWSNSPPKENPTLVPPVLNCQTSEWDLVCSVCSSFYCRNGFIIKNNQVPTRQILGLYGRPRQSFGGWIWCPVTFKILTFLTLLEMVWQVFGNTANQPGHVINQTVSKLQEWSLSGNNSPFFKFL